MDVRKTFLLHTSDGVIKVTPQGGRRVRVRAPAKVKITDRKGRAFGRIRKAPETRS